MYFGMNSNQNQLKKNLKYLIYITIIFISVFLVLRYGNLTTRRDVSPLIVPIKSEYQLSFKPTGVTFDGENIWISSSAENMIFKINPQNGIVINNYSTPTYSISDITYDGKNIWIIDSVSLKLYEIDLKNDMILTTFDIPGIKPLGLAYYKENFLISDPLLERLYYVSSTNGSLLKTINPPPPTTTPAGISIRDEDIWISDLETALILQYDIENDDIIANYYAPGNSNSGIAWDDEYLWSLDYVQNKLFRISPGERINPIIPLDVPNWFWTFVIIALIPFLLSIIASVRSKPKTRTYMEKKDRITEEFSYNKIGMILAITGSLYSAYELFRIIYYVAILKTFVFKLNQPIYMYRFEMMLCLYTVIFWSYYAIINIILPLFKK